MALKEFKAFVLRGNVIDLAVGVAVGAAFTAVVTSFTENLLTPLLAIPGEQASFADMAFEVNGATFRYGAFFDSVVSFVLVAAALFFLIVKPVNTLMSRNRTEPDVESPTRSCPHCLSNIPRPASRCAFCTAEVEPA